MGLRDTIRNWLGVDGRIRDLLRTEFAARSLPSATEVEELRARVDSLDKKLKMTMGSVQASGAQLMGLHDAVDKVRSQTAQATQLATTARSTAESAVDGVASVEERLAALESKPAPKKPSRRSTKTSKTSKNIKTR